MQGKAVRCWKLVGDEAWLWWVVPQLWLAQRLKTAATHLWSLGGLVSDHKRGSSTGAFSIATVLEGEDSSDKGKNKALVTCQNITLSFL